MNSNFLNILLTYYKYTLNLPLTLDILEKNKQLRDIIYDIKQNLHSGISFSKSLRNLKIINKEEEKFLKFAEENNFLIPAIEFILHSRQLKDNFRKNLLNQIRYPFIVLIFACLFLIFFKIKFLPEVERIYLEMNMTLHPLLKFWKLFFSLPYFVYILTFIILLMFLYLLSKLIYTYIQNKYNLIKDIKLLIFIIDIKGYIDNRALKTFFNSDFLKISDYFKGKIQDQDYFLLKLGEENENLREILLQLNDIYEKEFIIFLKRFSSMISVYVYIFSIGLVTFLILSYQLPLLFGKIG